jgi:hypothetical protein
LTKRDHGQTKANRAKTQKKYNSSPEQIKRRSERNQARAIMMKAGKVRKGDGKDVDHKDHRTSNNSRSNLQVQPKEINRKDGGPRAVDKLLNPRKRKR